MANHPGDFIWYELMSPDATASERFYGPMLEWRFGGRDDYREIEASEGHVGGILQLKPEMIAGGARPAWVGYVYVDDVDRMTASVVDGGGRIYMAPTTMPGVGRFAMVSDPQGAPFYVMTPTAPPGKPMEESHAYSYDRPRLGHCAWNELATRDVPAAFRFYGERFGWVKDGEMDMGPLGAYEFVRHAGRAPAGSPRGHGVLGAMMQMPPGVPFGGWTYYFRVRDVDAAVAHVEANGGRIVQPPTEIPGGDFSLRGVDPQGAAFAFVGGRRR